MAGRVASRMSVAAGVLGVVAALAASGGCSSSSRPSGFDTGNGSSGTSGSSGGLGSSSGGSFNGDGGAVIALDASCASATANTSPVPVYMLIGLDGSGSMAFDPLPDGGRGPDNQKWAAVVPALDSIFDDLLAKNDPAFAVGLFAFSDAHDTSLLNPACILGGNCYPASNDVGIGAVDQAHHDALRGRIDNTSPSGGTPTQAAMRGAYDALGKYAPATPVPPNGKKVFVFMTDGVPTNDPAFNAQAAANLAGQALSNGITTVAVGIGDFPSNDPGNYDPAFMGAIANAGGAAPPGCNPSENSDVTKVCHFQVTPGSKSAAQLTQDFIAAINKIRERVATCEYTLDKSQGNVDPTQVNVVYIDGSGKEHGFVKDPANGWTYDNDTNPTRVILHGADCDMVKADPRASIRIVLGCKTVTK